MLMARDDNMENPACHYMLRDDAFGRPRTYMRGVTDQCNTVSVNPIDGYVFWNKLVMALCITARLAIRTPIRK